MNREWSQAPRIEDHPQVMRERKNDSTTTRQHEGTTTRGNDNTRERQHDSTTTRGNDDTTTRQHEGTKASGKLGSGCKRPARGDEGTKTRRHDSTTNEGTKGRRDEGTKGRRDESTIVLRLKVEIEQRPFTSAKTNKHD
jgi:hypothetical protein